jgi:hypothetical protein
MFEDSEKRPDPDNKPINAGVDFGTSGATVFNLNPGVLVGASGGATAGYVQFDASNIFVNPYATAQPIQQPVQQPTQQQDPHINGRRTWGFLRGGHATEEEYLACDICQGGTHDDENDQSQEP